MNVFLAGWRETNGADDAVLRDALRALRETYPHLDEGTLWHQRINGLFAGGVCSSETFSATRRPLATRESETVWYEGSLADRLGDLRVYDAGELGLHWDELTEVLEGQFVVGRITGQPSPRVEIITDPLGMYPVFHCRDEDGGWLVSNSVQLLRSVMPGPHRMSDSGCALFLALGYTGGDLTLDDGVTVLSGGARWVWTAGATEPQRLGYFGPAALRKGSRSPLAQAVVERVASRLGHLLHHAADNSSGLECDLTGGRDSRLLVALLTHGELAVRYRTVGDARSADARMAGDLAARAGLDHYLVAPNPETIVGSWPDLSRRVLRQNDGMVSLIFTPNFALDGPVTPTRTRIWGGGGEIARADYTTANALRSITDGPRVEGYLRQLLVHTGRGLFTPDTVAVAVAHVKAFVDRYLGEGFSPLDVIDLFFTYERVRRYAGVNARAWTPWVTMFAPLCSRDFVQAAFEMAPRHRYAESLHYRLIRALWPVGVEYPFTTHGSTPTRWRVQNQFVQPLAVALESAVARVPHRVRGPIRAMLARLRDPSWVKPMSGFPLSFFLESQRARYREMCLDRRGAKVWDLTSRGEFERLMSPMTSAKERAARVADLFGIITLLAYDDLQAKTGSVATG